MFPYEPIETPELISRRGKQIFQALLLGRIITLAESLSRRLPPRPEPDRVSFRVARQVTEGRSNRFR